VPTSLVSGGTREPLTFGSAAQIIATLTPLISPTPLATGTRDIPPPPPIRYAGVPTSSAEAKWLDASTLWLGVPHRTQLDNSLYAQSNCGPASLGMILSAYGLSDYPIAGLRGEVNRIQGNFDPNEGTSLPALAAVGQRAGLYPMGLYGPAGGFKRWTVDDLREHLKAGRPIITLARYADLPGNSYFAGDINHYIVLSGLEGDNFIYNDAAYVQGRGRGLMIAPDVLQRAWADSNIPSHAVAFALNPEGNGLLGRTVLPHPESGFAEVEDEEEEPDATIVPPWAGDAALALESEPRELELAAERIAATPSSRGATAAQPTSGGAVIRPRGDGTLIQSMDDVQRAHLPATFVALSVLLAYAAGAFALGRIRA
jgi:hypothetical protein